MSKIRITEKKQADTKLTKVYNYNNGYEEYMRLDFVVTAFKLDNIINNKYDLFFKFQNQYICVDRNEVEVLS